MSLWVSMSVYFPFWVHYVVMGFNDCIFPVLDLVFRYGFQRLYISCFRFTVSLWVSTPVYFLF